MGANLAGCYCGDDVEKNGQHPKFSNVTTTSHTIDTKTNSTHKTQYTPLPQQTQTQSSTPTTDNNQSTGDTTKMHRLPISDTNSINNSNNNIDNNDNNDNAGNIFGLSIKTTKPLSSYTDFIDTPTNVKPDFNRNQTLDLYSDWRVQYTKSDDDPQKTFFHIKSCEYRNKDNDNNNNNNNDINEHALQNYQGYKFYWARFITKKQKGYRLSHGYFQILDYVQTDADKQFDKQLNISTPIAKSLKMKSVISTDHLDAFRMFVHDPQIIEYLKLNNEYDDLNINITIDDQLYVLQYWNGKPKKQCQAFSILKKPKQISNAADDDDEKKTNNKLKKANKQVKIHAIYFPKPRKQVTWKWYDNANAVFTDYENDKELILEFEASWYANIKTNFDSENKLFHSDRNKNSRFDYAFLDRFSKIMTARNNKKQSYVMRYLPDPSTNDLKLEQLRLQNHGEHYGRDVVRAINREKLLDDVIYKKLLNRTLSRHHQSYKVFKNPVFYTPKAKALTKDTSLTTPSTISWIALIISTSSHNIGKDTLVITSEGFDPDSSSQYPQKTISVKDLGIDGVEIKRITLYKHLMVQEQCGNRFMWAKFMDASGLKLSTCKKANGYWDTTFNDDNRSDKLRNHLDVILSALHQDAIIKHFGLKQRVNDKSEQWNSTPILTIQIDKYYEYELIWSNLQPIGVTQSLFIKQIIHPSINNNDNQQKDDNKVDQQINNTKSKPKGVKFDTDAIQQSVKPNTKQMKIMYFEQPKKSKHTWQWYDNDVSSFKNYTQPKDILQLECSYLSNLASNYPRYTLNGREKIPVNEFSHCVFTTLTNRQKNNTKKLYVIRFSVIHENENKLIVEQVAYQKSGEYPRDIRRIDNDDLKSQNKITIDISKQKRNQKISHYHNTCNSNKQYGNPIDRISETMCLYQRWLHSTKQKSLIEELKNKVYKTDNVSTKIQNDFHLIQKNKDKIRKAHEKISGTIKPKCATQCLCIKRNNRNRAEYNVNDEKERYFHFDDTQEICIQQKLDSIHSLLLHHFDADAAVLNRDVADDIRKLTQAQSNIFPEFSPNDDDDNDDDDNDDDKADDLPNTQIISHRSTLIYRTGKFISKEYNVYDTGIRFYYWKFYKDNKDWKISFKARIEDPGNVKSDGTYYIFKHWFVEPKAKDLKEEILNLTNNGFTAGITKDQYKIQYAKAEDNLSCDEAINSICDDRCWRDKYGIDYGSSMQLKHLLALQFYCNFTAVQLEFSQTFRRKDHNESDNDFKKRHSIVAWWARYLRECVECFGSKLRKGSKVPHEYYRGITKQYVFPGTILRFHGPFSTSVALSVARRFADNGLVLTLTPDWNGFRGNIRAFECASYSDYHHEEEYLFIGGLEPLVIYNIWDLQKKDKYYINELFTLNYIHQIFAGNIPPTGKVPFLARSVPLLAHTLIKNELMDVNDNNKKNDYEHKIFHQYCNNLTKITISTHLIKSHYNKKIEKLFINKDKNNSLKLMEFIELFPNCKIFELTDSNEYPLIPSGLPSNNNYNILSVINECIIKINQNQNINKYKFKLYTNDKIIDDLLTKYKDIYQKFNWTIAEGVEPSFYDQDEDFVYIIRRAKDK